MSDREKLEELRKVAQQKLNKVIEIQDDLESESPYKKYNHWDLERAMNEHTIAQNNHGKFLSGMEINNPSEPEGGVK